MTFAVQHYAGHAPIRIVARMDEPIGYLGDLLHIDGPIAYATYHDLDERTRKTIEPVEIAEFPIDLQLPLSTWWVTYDEPTHGPIDARLMKRNRQDRQDKSARLWGWCASAADESAWGVRSRLEIRKKPAIKEMGRYTDARTHNTGAGHMKAYDLAIPTVFAREVVWHAHGDADKVRALLAKFVPAIGKKRTTGSGTVREWVVETEAEDASILDEGGAALMRRMPAGAAEGSPGHGAIRPPYYHHTRVVRSVEPC